MLRYLEQLVTDFLQQRATGEICYNEAAMQFEMAVFLRSVLPNTWRVEFERPISQFVPHAPRLTKKEIDLVVASSDMASRYAIELKCPRQGQYPEQMFKACQDIAFLEELVEQGFNGGLFAFHATDPGFSSDGRKDAIYRFFRDGKPIQGEIVKPTGKRDSSVTIRGEYLLTWQDQPDKSRFYLGVVKPDGVTPSEADIDTEFPMPIEYRPALVILRMVHELHNRGFQKLRIVPGMNSSGTAWRCWITPSSNIEADHGALAIDESESKCARMTTGEGTKYFGWIDASADSPSELADKFTERFPNLLRPAHGRDWPYVGWFTEMLVSAEKGYLPYAYADWAEPSDESHLRTLGNNPDRLPMPPRVSESLESTSQH